MFNNLFAGIEKAHPKEWGVTAQTGLPKITGILTATDFRWLTRKGPHEPMVQPELEGAIQRTNSSD